MSTGTSRKILLSAVIALGAAGACAGDQPASVGQLHQNYDYQTFNSYHRNRDTLVEVHGNPLGLDPAAFGRAIGDAMRSSGVQTNFTTTPGASAEKNLRVVVSFNARPGNRGLCSAKPGGTASSAKTSITAVYAAWCWGDRVESEVATHVTPVTGIDDPRFRTMLAQSMRELFPGNKDMNRNNDRNRMNFLP